MKISLITVSYNSAATIEDTIKSVLGQTYADIEYLIIDGGSTDNTINIVKQYEPIFAGRMRWISEPDNGLYDAMNKGIRMATGDVVGIINSDDFFTSNIVIQNVVTTFDSNILLQCVYGDIHFVDYANINKCVRYYSSKYFSRTMLKYGLMPAHPSCYIRREVYNQYGLFNTKYKIVADFEALLRYIYIYNINIKYIPLDFVTMRTGGVSTSSYRARRQILKEIIQTFKDNNIKYNIFNLYLRYPYRLYELIRTKFIKVNK